MPTALIAYATTHGHTAKICRRIAEVLRAAGTDVDLAELATAAADADPASHDGTIVAASIHRGTHQHEVVDWIGRNRASLSGAALGARVGLSHRGGGHRRGPRGHGRPLP